MAGWCITGPVLHGRQLGRQLGFPTANIGVPDDCAASDGVYRSRVTVDGVSYDAMSNLGCNPSVGGGRRHLETYLFGFEGSLYGRTLHVELLIKIRDEHTFPTVEALRHQLEADRAAIEAMIASERSGAATERKKERL